MDATGEARDGGSGGLRGNEETGSGKGGGENAGKDPSNHLYAQFTGDHSQEETSGPCPRGQRPKTTKWGIVCVNPSFDTRDARAYCMIQNGSCVSASQPVFDALVAATANGR